MSDSPPETLRSLITKLEALAAEHGDETRVVVYDYDRNELRDAEPTIAFFKLPEYPVGYDDRSEKPRKGYSKAVEL